MYLTANLFNKPKFPDFSLTQLIRFFLFNSAGSRFLTRQTVQARQKLNKDLDVTTYIRTVNKVNGIVQCALDDKQRLMLKYNSQRVIDANSYRPFQYRQRTSMVDTANTIYEKFSEQGNLRKDDDFRFLIGLGQIWSDHFPQEFKLPAPPKKIQQTPVQQMNEQANLQLDS